MPSKLGGLPDLSYGPVTLDQAPVAYNPHAGDIWNTLADTAEGLQKKFQPQLDEIAANQGTASVTRDAQGKLQVTPRRVVLTEADQAYENAAHLKYMSEAALDAQTQLGQLRQQHANDPDGFASSLDGLIAGATKNAPPEFQAPITQMMLRDGGAIHQDLVNAKLANSAETAARSVSALYDANSNTLLDYAFQNKMTDPRAQDLLKQQIDLIRAQTGNPLFKMDQLQADLKIKDLQSALTAQGITGNAIAIYTQNPSLPPADVITKAVNELRDPALGLSPAEIASYESRIRQSISEVHAITWQKLTELKQAAEYRLDDAQQAALATGDYSKVISREEISAAYADNPQRAAQIIGKLDAASHIYSVRKSVALATPQQLAVMERQLNPANSGTVPSGFDAMWSQFTAPREGGYTPADSNGAPANFGINQAANPDIDVKNLTPAQAAKIAKDRYWTPSGAGSLAPELAAVQFETAFNMGVPAAKKLLAQSGGDVNTYLALREKRYRDIAAKDPSKAANLPVWLARNADLKNLISGGDVANQAHVYDAFADAVTRRNTMLAKDPAAYVLSARPEIGQAMGSKDPATVQNGVRALLTWQRDIGAQQPRILDRATTSAIVSQFKNPPDAKNPAQNMLGIVNALELRYGQYYPQVMAELRRAGMPSEAIALAQMKDDPVVAWRFADAINSGRDNLRKVITDPGEIDKSVNQALAPLFRTFIGRDGSGTAMAQWSEATQLYAYKLAAEGVADPARQAFQEVIGKHYTFTSSYRVPAGIDPDAVEKGGSQILQEIPTERFKAEQSLRDPRLTPETRQLMSAQILRGRGVWLNLPNDDGLYLAWPQENGFVPAHYADGKLIQFSWGQLTGAAGRGQAREPVLRDEMYTK